MSSPEDSTAAAVNKPDKPRPTPPRVKRRPGGPLHVARPGVELPQIVITHRDMRDISDLAVAAIQEANDPPNIFRFGTALARVRSDLGDPCAHGARADYADNLVGTEFFHGHDFCTWAWGF